MKRKIECEYYECDKYNYKKLENEKNIKQEQLISEAKTLLVRPNCLLRANCMTELSDTSELSDRHIHMYVSQYSRCPVYYIKMIETLR